MSGQIDDVRPEISGTRLASKAVVGEMVPITALVWREGHDAVGATLMVVPPGEHTPRAITMTQDRENVDRAHAVITPDRPGLWQFRIDAWCDPMATWRWAVSKKLEAGQTESQLANDLAHGVELFRRAAAEHTGPEAEHLRAVANVLANEGDLHARVSEAMSDKTINILQVHPLREEVRHGTVHKISVERREALVNSWYELFPRSTGGWDENGQPVHGTFATTSAALDRVAAMGFDTVYFPPIHPIGRINRKGRNNTLTPEPGDVGSPWAIGAKEGGHDAIHPELGTEQDFLDLLSHARDLGLEIALDLALQAAPDHPWAQEHPEFFTILADGTIAFAENPPKKYQDIYPLNFFNAPQEIYHEILRVVRHWVDLGVTTFRVDNPHTKPAEFWAWLIEEIHRTNPEVIFLAEAFTRPARLYGLAKSGFSQSYTYFTWKVTKEELTEFATDMVEMADVFRPNLFVNTPDILHASLQYGGRAMFAIRAALAATLSPLWGVYSGYELYEHRAVKPGSEEYLDSEKYQLKPRDFESAVARGDSLEPYITALNDIRRHNPALQQLRTLRFHAVDNDNIIAYSKVDPLSGNSVLVVVNLDPRNAQEATVRVDREALGLSGHGDYEVHDLITDARYTWSDTNFVRLDPMRDVAHIFQLPTVALEDREELAYRKVADYRP
ncbi:DUF3416 domain-containing protein [Corynebacterium poyangense]|uniref:Alpha-1,4-glucan:maltose-1-phosphate maltosyltransferase n=1 Tax=Corynebacterium poyangense TaxID=2684405 RepID=A0A7H0SNE2_9CORY|nr:alpha-1,4-glucan--maltose-1-phosphate maltosyltransferase [Corynebacterium poyangense]QNQ90067.1 DUF3416 domain-containing protein [Corynebacterium poyangense]